MNFHNVLYQKKVQLILYFLLLFSCLINDIKAQNTYKVDSLYKIAAKSDTSAIRARIELFNYYSKSDIELGKSHLDSVNNNALLDKYKDIKSLLYEAYANYYIQKGRFDTASVYANQGLVLAQLVKDKALEAKSWRNIGVIACEQGDIEKGMKCYMKAKLLYKELGNKYGEAGMAVNLGGANAMVRKYKTAEAYIKEGLSYLTTTNEQRTIMRTYSMLADVLSKQKKFDEAISIIKLERDMAIQLKDLYQLTVIDQGLGGIYYNQGKQDSAQFYTSKALRAFKKYNFSQGIAQSSMNLAGSYYESEKYDSALVYIRQGISISREIGSMRQVTQGYHLLSKINEKLNDYKGAYEASQRYNFLNDSLIGSENRKRMDELALTFKTKEKEYENELLMEKDKLNSIKLKQQKYLISLLIAIVLVIITVTIIFFKQRKIKEKHKKLELEQKALRAQMNPHFIFNSLNSIHRMFIQGDIDIANDYIGDFGELLRTILENSGKSAIPLNDEINTIKLYLEIEKMRTEEMIEYNLNIDPTIDVYNCLVPPLIIQPFVENSIWHGILPAERKGKITIDITRKDKSTLKCIITDNGIGIEQSKKQKKTEEHKSKGMKITEDRLNLSNSVKAEELPTGGTKVTILIPLVND